jgi:hypothetical protein
MFQQIADRTILASERIIARIARVEAGRYPSIDGRRQHTDAIRQQLVVEAGFRIFLIGALERDRGVVRRPPRQRGSDRNPLVAGVIDLAADIVSRRSEPVQKLLVLVQRAADIDATLDTTVAAG